MKPEKSQPVALQIAGKPDAVPGAIQKEHAACFPKLRSIAHLKRDYVEICQRFLLMANDMHVTELEQL